MPPSRPPSFLQRMARTRRPGRDLEPADMGTAFGLEQTVGDTPWSTPIAPQPQARQGWWRRLTGRAGQR